MIYIYSNAISLANQYFGYKLIDLYLFFFAFPAQATFPCVALCLLYSCFMGYALILLRFLMILMFYISRSCWLKVSTTESTCPFIVLINSESFKKVINFPGLRSLGKYNILSLTQSPLLLYRPISYDDHEVLLI